MYEPFSCPRMGAFRQGEILPSWARLYRPQADALPADHQMVVVCCNQVGGDGWEEYSLELAFPPGTTPCWPTVNRVRRGITEDGVAALGDLPDGVLVWLEVSDERDGDERWLPLAENLGRIRGR